MKPCCIILMVFLIGFTFGSKYQDVIKKCKENNAGDCQLGPYCFSFRTDKENEATLETDACMDGLGEEKASCGPVISVVKVDSDNFEVVMIAPIGKSGDVSVLLGFSEDSSILKDKNFGIACYSSTKSVEVVELTSSIENVKKASKQQSIKKASVSTSDGFAICEFQLSKNPTNGGKTLDLIKNKYHIGSFEQDGVKFTGTGVKSGYSAEPYDFFALLKTNNEAGKKKVTKSISSKKIGFFSGTFLGLGLLLVQLCTAILS